MGRRRTHVVGPCKGVLQSRFRPFDLPLPPPPRRSPLPKEGWLPREGPRGRGKERARALWGLGEAGEVVEGWRPSSKEPRELPDALRKKAEEGNPFRPKHQVSPVTSGKVLPQKR